jgi:hypothetical protein
VLPELSCVSCVGIVEQSACCQHWNAAWLEAELSWHASLLQVIGIELLAQTLLPAVEDLATDKHWRVRQAIIEHTPMLATQVRRPWGLGLVGLCDLR